MPMQINTAKNSTDLWILMAKDPPALQKVDLASSPV